MPKNQDSKDPYKIIGVARDADADVIKKAYRKLAQANHPDRNPDDAAAEERFKRISSAYAVLSDPERRRNFDEFGDVALDPNFDANKARQFGSGNHFGGASPGGAAGFGSIFEDLFSGGARGQNPFANVPRQGGDLESELMVDFMEAAQGCERKITVGRPQPTGGVRKDTLTIQIPSGVADGARIRLAGKGGEGSNGGPPGDLYCSIRVRPHRFFRREGQALHLEVPISLGEAVLGGDIEIPTLAGRVTLHIPAGTDGGSKLRLRGKGFPKSGRKAAGDLYVTVRIRVPKDLDESASEKVRELADLGPEGLRGDLFDE